MKDKLLIIGAGGHAKVVCDIAKNYYKTIVFADDNATGSVLSCPILCNVNNALALEKCDFIVAIGNNLVRAKIFDAFVQNGFKPATLIHPTAVIGENVEIGRGSVVMAGAVINPCVKVGFGCIINTCASVDHDCFVGDFTHLCPGVRFAGSVKAGKNCTFGVGTCVINNLTICDNVNCGAGAIVVKDLLQEGTYIGVPAKLK